MNRFALIVALLAAAGGLVCLYVYVERFEEEAMGGEPQLVLVSSRDIALGTRLEEDMLGRKLVPQRYVEERHVRVDDLQRVLGVRVASSVKSGEALLWTDLASSAISSRRVTGYLQDGMRALTVRGGSSSLIRPGDRVDILHTSQGATGFQTTLLVQNVIVIAVSGNVGPGRPGSSPDEMVVSGVTLALLPRQASFLTLAEQTGRLTFTVRPTSDVVIIQDPTPVRPGDLRNEEEIRRIVRRAAPRAQGTMGPTRLHPTGNHY